MNLYAICYNKILYSCDTIGCDFAPVNDFFTGEKAERSIVSLVDVRYGEVRERNNFGIFSWIPGTSTKLKEYLWKVSFVARFSPPNNGGRYLPKSSGINALGGYEDMYRPRSPSEDLSAGDWGVAQQLGGDMSVLGVWLNVKQYFPKKKFQFGYFVYKADHDGAPYVLMESNSDMYSTWYFGIKMLPDSNKYVSGKRSPCEVYEIQYGDKGGKAWRVVFKGK